MTWALMPLKGYATFSGRPRRKEYWMLLLFTVLVAIGSGIIDWLAGTYDYTAGQDPTRRAGRRRAGGVARGHWHGRVTMFRRTASWCC
jgi:uncharacterized membrane protein YhaH (DUF805 family)